ncbi:Serine/threonine-protein kinase tel1, partial [Ascosphaera pollenicola]
MADKNNSVYSMTLARPREIIELLLACTNRHIRPPSVQFHGPLTRISKAWFYSQLDSDLIKYLIGAEESDARIHPGTSTNSANYEELAKHQSNDDIVLELLHTKMKQLSQFWESVLTVEARLITSDTIRMLAPSCVIASFFVSLTAPSSENCYSELELTTRSLWLSLCSFFEKQDAEYFNTALDTMAPFVLPLKVPFSDDVIFDACLFVALRQLGGTITPYLKSLLSKSQAAGAVAAQAESVDIDMMVDEHESPTAFHELDLDICREDIPLLIYSNPALIARATIIHWLVLLELTEATSLVVSSSLADFLTTLKGPDLLVWRPAFQNLFSVNPEISRSDACRLVQHFGDNCLMAQDLMRTEAAPSMCVSLVTALLPLSYFDDSDELEKKMARLLEWFSTSLVRKAMGTPRTLRRVSALYHNIMMLPNLSSRGERRETYRQRLIELLSSSDLRVKYYFSGVLPSIFDQLPPDSHDEVFDQIFDGFPNYPDWIEGTA